MNFKNFGNDITTGAGGGGRPPGNFSLGRQTSVYSLTLDEFMNTVGGSGKDFGSINMDELLKNIWTAEELQSQTMAFTTAQQGMGTPVAGSGAGAGAAGGYLQRQGSLTLPRTLSQKTVDEVWKDISKDSGTGVGTGTGTGVANVSQTQRQQTLGEITLEEFLVRAGVVREDAQFFGGKPNGGVLADFGTVGFQQLNKGGAGLMGNNLPVNVNGVPSNQPQVPNSQPRQQQHHQIFPKQPAMAYAPQLGDQGMRGGMVGLVDQGLNGNLVPGSALQGGGIGMVGLAPAVGGGGVHHGTTGTGSSDEIGKSSGDTSSVSPVPYVFHGGGPRGRKSGGAVEKVIERRHRRMIKNRESAARSRARKQAYTTELEEEVAKLKEENEDLQRKQAEIVQIQKNQVREMMNLQQGVKKRCLRRTLTGPW